MQTISSVFDLMQSLILPNAKTMFYDNNNSNVCHYKYYDCKALNCSYLMNTLTRTHTHTSPLTHSRNNCHINCHLQFKKKTKTSFNVKWLFISYPLRLNSFPLCTCNVLFFRFFFIPATFPLSSTVFIYFFVLFLISRNNLALNWKCCFLSKKKKTPGSIVSNPKHHRHRRPLRIQWKFADNDNIVFWLVFLWVFLVQRHSLRAIDKRQHWRHQRNNIIRICRLNGNGTKKMRY